MTKTIFYAKYLPFDLLSIYQDQDLITDLIGDKMVAEAKRLRCTLHLLTGQYDFNSQQVQVGIQIQGGDQEVTVWLLGYEPNLAKRP